MGQRSALAGRRSYALSGSRSDLDSASTSVEERIDWAYMGCKDEDGYRKRLAAEDDQTVLGELVERAWGTDLLDQATVERAWHVGGRSRMSATLDPRCPEELASQWLGDWLAGRVNCRPLIDGYVLPALCLRHRKLTAQALEQADTAQLSVRAWHSVLKSEKFEDALTGKWDAVSATRALQALDGCDGEKRRAGVSLVHLLGLQQWAGQHPGLLVKAPVRALGDVWVGADSYRWPDGAEAIAVQWWDSFSGNVEELKDACCDLLSA